MFKKLRQWLRRMTDNKHRIYLLFVIVFLFSALASSSFLTAYNMTSILKNASFDIALAVGFTMVMIIGQLDLSIGSNAALGGICAIALQSHYGWVVSILAGIFFGAVVGLVNGLLVTKAKIHSFIATLATMTIVLGILNVITNGNTISSNNFALGDWLEHPLIPLLAPRVLIVLVLVIVAETFLTRTRAGKGFYVLGGNPETAFLAGLKTEGLTLIAFVFSGVTASLGGALYAISLSSSVSTMGADQLITVVAATIIGGTSMAGGVGSVFRSMVAVLTLIMLYNGLSLMGIGIGVQVFINGIVLALIVFQEVYSLYQQKKTRGQRKDLLDELAAAGKGR